MLCAVNEFSLQLLLSVISFSAIKNFVVFYIVYYIQTLCYSVLCVNSVCVYCRVYFEQVQ